ncbi:LLM class flavin-dependent oxidoreductase [Sulfurimonas sp. HSL3-7]|uniref:LLM class flavin-dependent oxidoreductase n=1 Tax=Sulfonitrofixus jiaomeiensis TaxID=3131938 RepID=UPI0031F7495E
MMRSALFAFFDNPHRDFTRALNEQVSLVREAENRGLDEVWVSEHHFNDYSVSGPILPLMAYLSGVTQRITVGSAAVLLPYHSPVMVAEALAVMERLNPGRILFGMAKGAFPLDDSHFRSDPVRNREALYEAALLIQRLLSEKNVTFEGNYFNLKQATVVPSPSGIIPGHIATFGSEESVRFAAEHGFGLMMGQTATLEQLSAAVTLYKRCSGRTPELTLLRLCYIDEDGKRARAQALLSAHAFSERMLAVKAQNTPRSDAGFGTTRKTLFASHPMASAALAGTPQECLEQLRGYQEAGVTSLAIRPGGSSLEENIAIINAFAEITSDKSVS